jgi:predicted  nucleic acid-binding Zn-ribbon protein
MSADTEARFVRIEATLERLADAQLRGEYALTDAIEQMARSQKQLLTAQVLLTDAQRITERQIEILALKRAETEDKLNALIDIVDRQTRHRGGSGQPANE